MLRREREKNRFIRTKTAREINFFRPSRSIIPVPSVTPRRLSQPSPPPANAQPNHTDHTQALRVLKFSLDHAKKITPTPSRPLYKARPRSLSPNCNQQHYNQDFNFDFDFDFNSRLYSTLLLSFLLFYLLSTLLHNGTKSC